MSFSNENVSFFAPFVALSANCIISNAYASMSSMALSFCHSFNPKTKWPFNCYALSFRFLLLVPKSQVQLTSNACSILIQYLLHYCQVCDERGTLTKVPCFSFLFFSFLSFCPKANLLSCLFFAHSFIWLLCCKDCAMECLF